ncbi:CHAT domain-containing protein [uncultured Bradyrhizobium sp.]|jgi:hypothetical protein|uniref:CHAT domain-containing protein n=1 Tax=uncultured Bradyrhizobium sp. TaxID=199684 RepID=UPI00261E631B|nr:CHAT domain-containing protein [uncultured Bradyrhizobium sp.]
MTERLLIDVGYFGDAFYCLLSGKQDKGVPLDLDAISAASKLSVRAGGTKIYEELCKNREVKKAIDRALDGEAQPIYINAWSIPAQGIRWESLWAGDPARFVSLSQTSSVARIAGTDTARNPARFKPPLRILAVISAEGRPAGPEWDELRQAIEFAQPTGLPIQVHVVTGDAALYAALQAAPAVNWLTYAAVPDTVDALSLEIEKFKPHVLHFFCHGQVDAGNAYLEIQGNVEELQLSIRELTQVTGLEDVWLVVLNSCLGGASLEGSPSMAYRIVSDGKVPFAIGATENVDVRDANRFTRAFYKRLLFSFGESIKAAGANDVLTLEWRQALYAAREAINKANQDTPETCTEWILPVLFEHRTRLQLIMPQPQAAGAISPELAALRLKMAKELLAALPPDTSEATKNQLIAAILGEPNG